MKPIACLLALSLLAPLTVVLTPQSAQAQQISVRIRLTGPALGGVLPEGKSEYKTSGAKRSFRTEVKANVADGTTLIVLVNGAIVGTVTMAAGVGSLSLATERGQSVPLITSGTSVSVQTETSLSLLSGTF